MPQHQMNPRHELARTHEIREIGSLITQEYPVTTHINRLIKNLHRRGTANLPAYSQGAGTAGV